MKDLANYLLEQSDLKQRKYFEIFCRKICEERRNELKIMRSFGNLSSSYGGNSIKDMEIKLKQALNSEKLKDNIESYAPALQHFLHISNESGMTVATQLQLAIILTEGETSPQCINELSYIIRNHQDNVFQCAESIIKMARRELEQENKNNPGNDITFNNILLERLAMLRSKRMNKSIEYCKEYILKYMS
jgi:hypothetical protein